MRCPKCKKSMSEADDDLDDILGYREYVCRDCGITKKGKGSQ